MGIRTFLSRTGPGVASQPVPAFEAAASTVRVPVTFGTALRRATADLRQRLAVGGRRPFGGAGPVAGTALPGAVGPTAAPALAGADDPAAPTGLVGTDALVALTALVGTKAVVDLAGVVDPAALAGLVAGATTPARSGPQPVTGPAPVEIRFPGTPGIPGGQGKPSRPWVRLARGYLTLVLTLLPRPRPAHTTITVYITTNGGAVSERPGGSAP
ncbi:hypothetical protein ADK65_18400 [Streptomyces sp. NRRL B-1140]|uniref:hypothetical protein n=1 Tax=Streptomyces sp. NRRL B-1140 TaxID=1415549 RepID=UPI0006AE2CCF|nr:hypothetical protein [Streptomyces sp. NRRL B-1140]KOV99402.1 hypothetical protein ADK65_18400 [Streptomyces sp. NRRL B-1140]